MSSDPKWRRYHRFFGRRGVADLDDELRFHVEMRVRDYMARGMSEPEARAATAQRLGDVANARDACVTITTRRERRMTRAQIVDALVQDVKFAFRSLGRQKGWTAVAVVTLALGIGANSAMFSVVNHLLLNPLPYPNADRIVLVSQEPSRGAAPGGVSVMLTPMGRVVSAWRDHARSFEALEPYWLSDATIQRSGETARVAQTAEILPSLAAFAGQRPIVGRMFTDAEARGEASVVVISESLWRSHFGADERVVGTVLTVSEKPVTIVGVMPGTFQLPRGRDRDMDLWLPLDIARRDDDGLFLIGRLHPAITRATAVAELDSISHRDLTHGVNNSRFRATLKGPADVVDFKDALVMLSVAVALVLLIACANVAHLLLARASTRTREMAIRAALGAGTNRLFRQLLTESMILSVAGCIGGLVIGGAGLRVLVSTRPDSVSELAAAKMDGMTFLVAALLSVVTGILFGVVGAVQAARHSTHEALKAGPLLTSPNRARGGARGGARGLLVVTEMALSTMLLVGATLLLRSVIHLQNQNAGFDAKGLYSLEVHLPEDRYRGTARVGAFFTELAARARAIPGVQGVTQASAGPLSMSYKIGALQLEGQPNPPAGTTEFIPYNGVGPEFFRLMGIRMVRGTTFTDTSAAALQAIVNEGFARKHWPGQSPIGRRLRILYDGKGEWHTIVGVAADAMTRGLTEDAGEPLLYMPGTGVFRPSVIVRTSGGARMMPVLAGIVSSIDRRLPPPQMSSVELQMQKSIARPRFTMFLLMIFTIVAVGLAAIGLYGVLAYSVAQRTREIGIRMALGASRRLVARSVLSQGLALAVLGALIGLVAARGGVKLLGSMLYGVQQGDAASFAVSAVVVVVVAVAACLWPVRRALSVDPLIAMRAE
ncbi:MAG: ABC transporter permease [Gemmatimonadaceae bacterium]